ncbi:hypothetical protein P152DRAFT_185416 [Eremomyces bilateralis CBS 781.70]|uniref:Protein kinase domain-containing protein n=1 Tax=Eremomyces bilateralis CBS 781.70 TaxID=1392243 RepID=A0A6G1GBK4_9PEZI|nr:uncharacterized protein P152DRAFT_185416 [Eremomyces bilateralis CBS 781.70]KAF1815433.1 hypothetical protein P152DRAFT_185416 [Eremomyces bilateralis CBS 781.70]
MEISASLYEILCTPVAAFLDPTDFLNDLVPRNDADDGHHDEGQNLKEERIGEMEATESPTISKPNQNPGSRSPNAAKRRMWRIHGSAAAGTRLFAVPLFLESTVPLRIDCLIPDQREHSRKVQKKYQPSALCCNRADDIRCLPIVTRVLDILDDWTRSQNISATDIVNSPFGSSIIIPYLDDDAGLIPVQFHRNHELEQQMLPLEVLRNIWTEVPLDQWPSVLDLHELDLQQQIHDTVSVVRIRNKPEYGQVIFKSSVEGCFYLYHEIKILLSLPSHSNIVSRPLFLVTKRCGFGSKIGVCGFIIRYFPLGSLRDMLPKLRHSSTQSLRLSCQWAIEICSAMLHVKKNRSYYCDLRTDNIVIDGPNLTSTTSTSPSTILIDLEQRGNWRFWSPPEVFYLDYLQHLVNSDTEDVPLEYRAQCRELLDIFKCDITSDAEDMHYEAYALQGIQNANTVWNALSEVQQESATVYMLGRLLWCLFEHVGRPNRIDALWKAGLDDSSIEFPTFVSCPASVRDLILRCTAGAPEHDGRLPAVYRLGQTVLPRDRSAATDQETLHKSTGWWKAELQAMEKFLKDREHQRKHHSGEKIFDRPNLAEVLEELKISQALYDA